MHEVTAFSMDLPCPCHEVNTRQNSLFPTSSPPTSLFFSSFDIMIPEDPEQVDPEQGLGTTESLHMSGYSSRFLSEWVMMALQAT